jgi:hypothetical protein
VVSGFEEVANRMGMESELRASAGNSACLV